MEGLGAHEALSCRRRNTTWQTQCGEQYVLDGRRGLLLTRTHCVAGRVVRGRTGRRGGGHKKTNVENSGRHSLENDTGEGRKAADLIGRRWGEQRRRQSLAARHGCLLCRCNPQIQHALKTLRQIFQTFDKILFPLFQLPLFRKKTNGDGVGTHRRATRPPD